MKLNKTLLIGLVFSASLLAGIYGCSSNDSEMKSVDLRYKVDDSYLVEASEPELITFTVKSSDPWSVFGTDEEWYEISPNEGQADSIYTVKLQCKENTDLDDRSDTITIKSDYWVGKQFQVTQKGTAFISIGGSNFELPQETSEDTFTIHSNQKWSAKVTAGEDWLTITSADNGEKDGTLTVQAILNKGEKRTGEVTIYDRYETPYLIATYTQDGVMLNPAAPENGKWYALYSEAQSIVIPVESNGDWIVSKENEEDDDWFSFENTSFSGSDDIVVNFSEHIGMSVRTATVILTSVAEEEGIIPVQKKVIIKQANPQIPKVTESNQSISGNWYGPDELMPGLYNFYVGPMSASTSFQLFIIIGDYEIRYWLEEGKTVPSTRPWSGDIFMDNPNCHKPVDFSKQNVISLDIQKYMDDKGESWVYVEWLLNGELVCYGIANGTTLDGGTDTWVMPWSTFDAGASLFIRAEGGTGTLEKFEYIAPIDWGE